MESPRKKLGLRSASRTSGHSNRLGKPVVGFVRLGKAVDVMDVIRNRVGTGGNGVWSTVGADGNGCSYILRRWLRLRESPRCSGFSLGCVLDQIVLAAPAVGPAIVIDLPPDRLHLVLGGTGGNGTKCILRLSVPPGVPRTFMFAVACTVSPITNLLVVGGGDALLTVTLIPVPIVVHLK